MLWNAGDVYGYNPCDEYGRVTIISGGCLPENVALSCAANINEGAGRLRTTEDMTMAWYVISSDLLI